MGVRSILAAKKIIVVIYGEHKASIIRRAVDGEVTDEVTASFLDMLSGICPSPRGTPPQTIIVFSPHPDDDVISMGGTLITLAEQGHDVHIAYMTRGNIAVFDDDALRHIDYANGYLEIFELVSPSKPAVTPRPNTAAHHIHLVGCSKGVV